MSHRIERTAPRDGGRLLRRMSAALLRLGPPLAAAALVWGVATEALGRPGGGSGFSGGGSSGGFSGGGSSGGGGEGDLIVMLVWLAFRHPAIGVPLLVVAGVVFMVRARATKGRTDWASSMPAPAHHRAAPAVSARRTLEKLRLYDPDFSLVVFEDFLYGLYQKAHELRGGDRIDQLGPYLSEPARAALRTRAPGVQDVRGVVVGAMRLSFVGGLAEETAQRVTVRVKFEGNYTEQTGDQQQSFYVAEQWHLVRRRDAKSRSPDRARAFECPSCGAPLEGLTGSVCGYCNTQVDTGDLDWVVTAVELLRKEARPPALIGGAEEVGTQLPTVRDPRVRSVLETLQQRDPSFDLDAFQRRVVLIHRELNAGWSALDWKRIRPYLSDSLFETQCYWLEAYRAAGLRNVLENARVTNMELAAVTSDKWFDAITVRVFATGRDYTIRDRDRHVVGGSKRRERPYSEYWTLIRGRTVRGPSRTEPGCPKCGAPLEVNQGGTCEYCKARVSTGEFDWVLSRIEQDEAYAG